MVCNANSNLCMLSSLDSARFCNRGLYFTWLFENVRTWLKQLFLLIFLQKKSKNVSLGIFVITLRSADILPDLAEYIFKFI